MGKTKEEILIAALHLFARDGYEAVSVSQIAGELNMTKGALYRHYKSKRDIFDHIVERMEQGEEAQANQFGVPADSVQNMPEKYCTAPLSNLVEYSKSMFTYWTEDDFAASFRRMLTLEQFRSREMQALYQQYLVAGPVRYVKDLFDGIGIADAEYKAAKFYSTMFLFYSIYDGAEGKTAVKEQFERAIHQVAKECS